MISILLLFIFNQSPEPAFLRIPVFARPAGLGGSYVSLSDDAAAIFYNPAGINSSQTGINFTEWLFDTRFTALASYYRFKNTVAVGIGFYYLSYGRIEQYDENEILIGDFSPYSYVAIISLAKPITKNLSLGISGKFLSEKIYKTTNNGWAGDIGLKFSHSLFSIGTDFKNFSKTTQSFIKELGFSITPVKSLLVCLDFAHYTKLTLRTGFEYKIMPLAFRFGLNDTKPTFGVGYIQKSFSFDYAFINFPDLGLIHEFSLSLGVK
uniref:PorV/PorQ family protein n=1 Tax=candidate division WOR-3 bacterium TaxID=2052148 RepID=A0A7C6EAY7_UNCW3